MTQKEKKPISIPKVSLLSALNLACIILLFCYLLIFFPAQQNQILNDLLNSNLLIDKFNYLENRVDSLKKEAIQESQAMVKKMQDDAVEIFLQKISNFKSDREAYLEKSLLALYSIKKRLYQGISYNDLLFNIKSYYDVNISEKLQNALDLLTKYSYGGVSSFYELQKKIPNIAAENKIDNKIIAEFISIQTQENLVLQSALTKIKELILLGELESAIDAMENLPQEYILTDWFKEIKTVAAVHFALDEVFKDFKDEVMRSND